MDDAYRFAFKLWSKLSDIMWALKDQFVLDFVTPANEAHLQRETFFPSTAVALVKKIRERLPCDLDVDYFVKQAIESLARILQIMKYIDGAPKAM